MHGRERLPRARLVDGAVLRFQHQFVQGALRRAVAAVDRPGAGDVGGVTLELGAGIDQQQVAVAQRRVVGAVVQDAGIGAAADDGFVARHRMVAVEGVDQFGGNHRLAGTGPGRAHRAQVRLGGDLRRLRHHPQFGARLEQAQVVQDVRERDEFVRRTGALTHLRPHAVDPADQLLVELDLAAEVVVDALAPFDHAGQDVVDVVDRKRVVEGELVDRAFRAEARPVPAFALGIAFAAEQDDFAGLAARDQGQHRLRLVEAGQVVEVAVLPVRIMRVVVADALGRRRQDGDGVATDDAHQLATAALVLGRGDQRRGRHGQCRFAAAAHSSRSIRAATRTNSSTSA